MDIFKLLGTIAINNSGAMSAMDATSKKAGSLQQTMTKAFDKIGKAAVQCGKVIATGLATGLGTITTLSIKAYADYEQLVGGVETLFKESSSTIIKYANNAYKTAGLSANAYMETVTSFSASLLQGLGGDTAAAAEMANMAITDMSDNANKMGTDMSSIQYAYQGFAKKNYTMLDNLKLGYGGTAAEMARLVNESGVLGEGITVTAETINEVSFDTIIRAIHVVQTEMGITGTTAKEAAETISGSFSSMKASWTNLMIGISDGSMDVNALTDQFIDSLMTFGGNIAKRIPMITKSIGKIIQKILPEIISSIGKWWNGGEGLLDTIIGGAKLVLPMFGMPYTHEVHVTIKKWWADAKKVVEQICTWTLGMFENPNATANEIGEAFSVWWVETALPTIKNISKWALNLFGVPVEDGATISQHVAGWWKAISHFVVDACAWTLSLFGVPAEDATAAAQTVKGWWDTVIDAVEKVCSFTLKAIGVKPWTEEDTAAVRTWWGGVLNSISEAIQWMLEPKLLDPDAMIAKIEEWWAKVKSGIRLTFGITAVINQEVRTRQQVNSNIGAAVTETTGSAVLGQLAETNAHTFETNSDSFIDFSNIFGNLFGFADGLDFVPYNEMPARLHFGEAVLTKEEARIWRSQQSAKTPIVNIDTESLAASIAEAVQNRPVAMNIDGRAFAALMAKDMSRSIGNRNIQTLMGMGG